jgi:hypothetical protein
MEAIVILEIRSAPEILRFLKRLIEDAGVCRFLHVAKLGIKFVFTATPSPAGIIRHLRQRVGEC